MRPEVLLFDVNETLLDVKALAPRFTAAFGNADLLPDWFGLLLRYSLEVTVTGDYRPFDELAVGALVTSAARADMPIDLDEATALVDAMSEMPAHPDVASGLEQLKSAGFRLATLTNSRPDVAIDQLKYASIDGYFEAALSVESVGRFKPHPDTYVYAADTLGVPIERCTLVAAHDWDCLLYTSPSPRD